PCGLGLGASALRGLAAPPGGPRPASGPGPARGPAELLDLAERGVAALAERGTPFPEAEADLALARAEAARHRGEDPVALWRAAADRDTPLPPPHPPGYPRVPGAGGPARAPRTAQAPATARPAPPAAPPPRPPPPCP